LRRRLRWEATTRAGSDLASRRLYFGRHWRFGEYLEAAGIEAAPKETLLFREALGNRKALSDGPLAANDMRRLLSGG